MNAVDTDPELYALFCFAGQQRFCFWIFFACSATYTYEQHKNHLLKPCHPDISSSAQILPPDGAGRLMSPL